MDDLKRTPLAALHEELGARMVPFAGWQMPVQFPAGILKEHQHTRAAASLFDVSHMGQLILRGDDAAKALETLVPADFIGLAEGRQRYGLLTGDAGGILDDLMVTNRGDHLYLVVNASRADADIAHLEAHMPGALEPIENRALLAVQGPAAELVLSGLVPGVGELRFLDTATLPWAGAEVWVSRSGYTGEDGFEISLPAERAESFARALLADPSIAPAGLGARDSLRLEAGLPLHGHDIDETTTPVEAALSWSIQKVRREDGARAGGFPGAEQVLAQLADGPPRRRVGLRPEGKSPMREGVELFETETADAATGQITSGGFGPTVGAPVAMGYLPVALATAGTRVWGEQRGKRLPLVVTELPFTQANYKR